MKCGFCGLEMNGHTDEKCAVVVRRERDAAVMMLKDMAKLLGKATKTVRTVVRWLKDHKAQEAVRPQEHQTDKR